MFLKRQSRRKDGKAHVYCSVCGNRLLSPRSELYVHEKWFAKTAMDVMLDTGAAVAGKDRLVAHKLTLEKHLAQEWRDRFGATFDVPLYDLTSTYFEGEAAAVPSAQRRYSRDHRPDCRLQVVLALVVTPRASR